MPPELKGLQHIGLKVRNIEASVTFYVDIMGFHTNERLRFDPPRKIYAAQNFISCTGYHHVINLSMLTLENQPTPAPPTDNSRTSPAFGLHHMAFEVENKEALEEWETHLRANGVEISAGPVVHSPTHPDGDGLWGENRAMYFCDPDGNAIEIFCDMATVGEDGIFDAKQHAARIKSDGYDPKDVKLPTVTR